MRLEKNICLGGRFNGRIIEGIKYRGYYIYKRIYEPYEFKYNTTITEVNTLVDESNTDLGLMFYECNSLISVNTQDWNTSSVTNMNHMFYECYKLESLDLNNWNTGNVTTMNTMFGGCRSLTSLDLSNWDVSNVTDMGHMFNCCYVETLNLSGWDMSKVSRRYYMFYDCINLRELRLDNCDKDTIRKIITSEGFPTGSLYEGRKIWCDPDVVDEDLMSLLPEGWEFVDQDTGEVIVPEESEDPENPGKPESFQGNKTITEVQTTVNNTHTDLSDMFSGCTSLTSVNTQDWDTSNVTLLNFMFYKCTSLTSMDLSNWNTSNVIGAIHMFSQCTSLTSVNLSNWNTSSLIACYDMFNNCTSLTSVNLSGWDISNITNMTNIGSMFYNCKALHTLILDNCSTDTINKIITSSGFPTGTISSGATRKIYCDKTAVEAAGLTAPKGWDFENANKDAQ
jgi:surface protein